MNLDPTIGSEIKKKRPAIVISIDAISASDLRIIVPITEFKEQHKIYPWCVPLSGNSRNGLAKQSTADARQIKSASVERFLGKLGTLPASTVEEITAAVGLCIDL